MHSVNFFQRQLILSKVCSFSPEPAMREKKEQRYKLIHVRCTEMFTSPTPGVLSYKHLQRPYVKIF